MRAMTVCFFSCFILVFVHDVVSFALPSISRCDSKICSAGFFSRRRDFCFYKSTCNTEQRNSDVHLLKSYRLRRRTVIFEGIPRNGVSLIDCSDSEGEQLNGSSNNEEVLHSVGEKTGKTPWRINARRRRAAQRGNIKVGSFAWGEAIREDSINHGVSVIKNSKRPAVSRRWRRFRRLRTRTSAETNEARATIDVAHAAGTKLVFDQKTEMQMMRGNLSLADMVYTTVVKNQKVTNYEGSELNDGDIPKINVLGAVFRGRKQIITNATRFDSAEPSASRRITFSASNELTRIFSLDERYDPLLDDYMTQPVEQYSVKSFHEHDKSTGSRRWLVRRLSEEESLAYRAYTDMETGEYVCNTKDSLFRLAVPLLPLLGLDITPVIDLEVLPASKMKYNSLHKHSPKTSSETYGGVDKKRNMLNKVLRVSRFRKDKKEDYEQNDAVRIRSLKVSLLSTEDEVNTIMQESRKIPGSTHQFDPGPSPTPVSQNMSVRKMGYEAIGMFGKIGESIEPHVSFDVRITWEAGETNPNSKLSGEAGVNQQGNRKKSSVTVSSRAVASLAPPSLPIALPSSLIIRRVGSIVVKKALQAGTNRFLRQLEKDFERWANINDES